MKKCWILVLLCCLLSGCADTPTFETLGSVPQQPQENPVPHQVSLTLPADAAQDVFSGEQEAVYTCENYTIYVQTMTSGDLGATVKSLCGYDEEALTVLKSPEGSFRRYDWVWTAAGESGDLLGRAAVIDDGNFHYCLAVLGPAGTAGDQAEQWNTLFSSFTLTPAQEAEP